VGANRARLVIGWGEIRWTYRSGEQAQRLCGPAEWLVEIADPTVVAFRGLAVRDLRSEEQRKVELPSRQALSSPGRRKPTSSVRSSVD
jgi:hypothetical protein